MARAVLSSTTTEEDARLTEHRAYLEGLGDHPMADPETVRDWLESAGRQTLGRGAAVTFELFSF